MKNNPFLLLTYGIGLLILVIGIILLPILWYTSVAWCEIGVLDLPLAISILYYYSFIRLKTIYCKPLFYSFQEKTPQKSIRSNLQFLLSHWSFWVESAALVLVFFLFPIEESHPLLADAYFHIFGEVNKLKILCVFLPSLLTINLAAHYSAILLWQTESKWRKYENKKTKTRCFISTMAIYTFAPLLIAVLLPMLQYIPLSTKAIWLFMTPATRVLVLALLLALALIPPLRAYKIRKKAIRQIKESCVQMGYTVSDIKLPYLSIFKPCEGESFCITKGSKAYSCKFIAALKKGVPMAIHPNGEMHFLHALRIRGVQFFSYKTVKRFAYHSDNSKILIVNPVPKKLMAYRGAIVEIDNGQMVGDYKVYNTTAFIRALENDILER